MEIQLEDIKNLFKDEKQVSFPEGFIFISITLVAEIFEFIFATTVIGITAAFFINLIVWFVTTLWLLFKGSIGFRGRMKRKIGKIAVMYSLSALADAITGGFLPLKAISLAITIYLLNHPKLEDFFEDIESLDLRDAYNDLAGDGEEQYV